MLWAFEKSIFQFFPNFWVTNLKQCSGKARQSVQIYLNQNLVIRTFLENGSGATLSSKTNVMTVWRRFSVSVFCRFFSDEVESIVWEVRQSLQSHLNQNLVKGSFLENCFETNLSPITNVLSVWKGHFSVFFKFLSDEVETISWESEAKRSNLSK